MIDVQKVSVNRLLENSVLLPLISYGQSARWTELMGHSSPVVINLSVDRFSQSRFSDQQTHVAGLILFRKQFKGEFYYDS